MSQNDSLDRSALPIPEPYYPPITEIDVRKAKAPPRFEVKPPPGAPNVLLILLDNLGYSASKTFGGVINMPTLERLAANGLIYNNFHTAPLCSPSRMAVLTGRNPHSANMGSVAEVATSFPGNTGKRPLSVAPLGEMLNLNGYSTAYFGKSHEFATWEQGLYGTFASWPTQFGFDRFYGTLSGEGDMFTPPLRTDRTPVDLPDDPVYYYQTDLANHAIAYIQAQKAMTPDKPFFIYYAAPGTHAPSQVPEEWLNKYKGKFDHGWDKHREQTLARQKALGIVPPNTQLASKPAEMLDWEKLSDDQKKVMTRQEEIFAAYAEITDHEVGRVVNAIEELGVMDNTLIIYITGDNGSSGNGGPGGMFNSVWAYNQKPETLQDQLKHFDEFGGPESDMTPPLGWAIADDTPFAYCQFFATYGGTTNGAVLHWPKGIKAKKEIRPQYSHLIDIAPTILEAAGLPEPKTVNGIPQKPLEGVSMLYTFDDPQAKSRHTVQYCEFAGNRGIYKDGWYAVTTHLLAWNPQPLATFENDKWELYNTVEDFSCAIDLAAKYPDKLKEMQGLFLTEGVKYNVLPLDDRVYERFNPAVAGRPDIMGGRTSLALYEGMVSMPENAFINTKNTSYSITADVEIPAAGADGVIFAQGGGHAGYSLYVKDNKLKFAYNYLKDVTTIASPKALPAGRVTIGYDFAYDGGKLGSGGSGTISVNGQKVASGRIESTIPYLFGAETADVGMNLYSNVTSDYAKGSKNKFTGKIHKVTIDLKATTSSEAEAKNSKVAARSA